MIRYANINDINILCNFRVLLEQEDGIEENFAYLYTMMKNYYMIHLNKDCYVLVYTINDKIIACACLILSIKNNKKIGYLCNVYTLKEYRNKGIQTKLLKTCLQEAKKYNIYSINLNVNKNNKKAINLYGKLGFYFL